MEITYAVVAGLLVGLVAGVVAATSVVLVVLRRRVDRDLIERRIRACADLRDALSDIELWLAREPDSPRVVEQAWWSVDEFCREFRRTGWLLEPAVRKRAAAVVDRLEQERRRCTENEAGVGHVSQIICQEVREIDHLLARASARGARAFDRFVAPDAASATEATATSEEAKEP